MLDRAWELGRRLEDPPRLRKQVRLAGLSLMQLGLSLGSLSIFTAHPAFGLGMWPDAEPMGIVFLGASALCFAGLGILGLESGAPVRSLGHPIVLAPTALGVWSLLAAPATALPMLSLFGPPENHLGALWYLCFAGLTASAMILRRHAALFRSTVAIAAAAALIAAGLNLWRIDWPNDWRPWLDWMTRKTLLEFNEYQAYYALALMTIALVSLRAGPRRFGRWLVAAGLMSLAASRNRAAMIAMAVGYAPVLLAPYLTRVHAFRARASMPPRLWAGAVVGAIVLIAGASYAVLRMADLRGIAPTLRSRRVLFDGIEPSLFSDATAVALGHGWGRYADHLTTNLTSAGIRLFDKEWGGLGRDLFHSHHAFLEALFAVGLPGLVLALAIPIAAALGAQRRWRAPAAAFTLSWTVIDSFWFMMPATVPVLALACGALAESSCRIRWRRRRWPWSTGLIGFAVLILAGGGDALCQCAGHDTACRLPGGRPVSCRLRRRFGADRSTPRGTRVGSDDWRDGAGHASGKGALGGTSPRSASCSGRSPAP